MGKRSIDLLLCLMALPTVLAVALPIALAIKMGSPGPVFYRARRVGRDGKLFDVLKFRSMTTGEAGPAVTRSGDSRITPVGRWLRATKLDELPQILNVVRGQMSIVGPRPEDPRYVAQYTAEQRQVLRVRPGMTCMAFLRFGDEQEYIEHQKPADIDSFYLAEIMPEKIAIELEYVRSWSLGRDFSIIAHTLCRILTKDSQAVDFRGANPMSESFGDCIETVPFRVLQSDLSASTTLRIPAQVDHRVGSMTQGVA
ncbi:MAG: sugar transferase [Actinomycetia bacterium]|nr:sugar transferase [Actinomycetes bacterium]